MNKIDTNSKKSSGIPLDVKIVSLFFLILGGISVPLILLTIIGIGRFPSPKPVLGGLILLSSHLSIEVLEFLIGVIFVVTGYGLAVKWKHGWYLCLFVSLYGILDAVSMLKKFPASTFITICMDLGIIIWLFWRRRLYSIGIRLEMKV